MDKSLPIAIEVDVQPIDLALRSALPTSTPLLIDQHDLDLARRVHESLLAKPVRNERIDVDVRYLPVAPVGGDYCQVLFPVPDVCYITVCDVSGHSIGAALLAARPSSEVRHWIHQLREPAEIIARLNAFVLEHFEDTNLLLSFSVLRIELASHSATWSGAGHPGPIVQFRDGAIGLATPLVSQHALIGVAETVWQDEKPQRSFQLASGDRFVLFSDGLTESRNEHGELFGRERLQDAAREARSLPLFGVADHLLHRAGQFRLAPSADDLTLIVAEVR